MIPCIFSDSTMKTGSWYFSVGMFWIENIVLYIPYQLAAEIYYLFVNYFRTLIAILQLSWAKDLPKFLAFWVFCGPFFLLVGLVTDMYNFILVLSDYKDNPAE